MHHIMWLPVPARHLDENASVRMVATPMYRVPKFPVPFSLLDMGEKCTQSRLINALEVKSLSIQKLYGPIPVTAATVPRSQAQNSRCRPLKSVVFAHAARSRLHHIRVMS